MKAVYLDTGPLVAFFNRRDQFHHWAQDQISEIKGYFISTESVLTEVLHLTKNSPQVLNALQGMIEDGILQIQSVLPDHNEELFNRLSKYRDISTSIADIGLLCLYNDENAPIFTIDSDFLIYRDSRNKPLNLIIPYVN